MSKKGKKAKPSRRCRNDSVAKAISLDPMEQFSASTKQILKDINKVSRKYESKREDDYYQVLDYSYQQYNLFEAETERWKHYDKVTGGLRVSYEFYADIPGIAVFAISEAHQDACSLLSYAINKGISTGQIGPPCNYVKLGPRTPTIQVPHGNECFEPDGLGRRFNEFGRPYFLWESNYRRYPLPEARRRLHRWMRAFAGTVRVGVLLGWDEDERVWVMEVYRYFDAQLPDDNIHLPDELDREHELQCIRGVREGLRIRHAVYLQSQPYIVWPPERRVEWVPLSMMDLFDGFWNEVSANDEQRRPNATFRFIIGDFSPFS